MKGAADDKNKLLVFEHWDLLDSLAKKRFQDHNLADEALLYVHKSLAADDWRRVRQFQGKASFARYLTMVTRNLLEDFAKSKFGYFRPPKWVRGLGPLWERIFKLLCLQRMSPSDVVESLCDTAPQGRDRKSLRQAVDTILEKIPDCGTKTSQQVQTSDEQIEWRLNQDPLTVPSSSEEEAMRREKGDMLRSLSFLLGAPKANAQDLAPTSQLASSIEDFCERLTLSDEECLFLRMIYQDEMTVSAAGRMLGWQTDQAHGKQRRLLARIRKILEETDLAESLMELIRGEHNS